MKTAYFFSGFAHGFPGKIARSLQKNLQARQSLCFIPTTPKDYQTNIYYARATQLWFEQARVPFERYIILDDQLPPEDLCALARQASAIFLMGGDTLAQHQFLKDMGLFPLLKTLACPIMGLSAGAINMGQTVLSIKDKYTPKTRVYQGLGLGDITVAPHFNPGDLPLVDELKALSSSFPIYGLADEGAILLRGSQRRFAGTVYSFHKGEMAQLSPSSSF